MKLRGIRSIGLLLLAMLMSVMLPLNHSDLQAQTPYTNTGKAKYVKTTVDTFSIPGVTGAYRQGIITNQSASLSLNVMFSKRDGTKDTSSRVVIPAGKTLYFNFVGTKIYRYAVTGADSVYSQVIVGDVRLNYNETDLLNDLCEKEVITQTEAVFAYFDDKPFLKEKYSYVIPLIRNSFWE